MTNENLAEEVSPTENGSEPKAKKKKTTLWRSLRNVIIIMVIFVAIFYFSPFELIFTSVDTMHPEMPNSSVSIAVKTNKDTEYKVGDIVVFELDYNGTHYSCIAHRIVAINGDIIQTKGDNNATNDPFTIKKSQIRAIVKWTNIFNK